jgi:hypothetical protein
LGALRPTYYRFNLTRWFILPIIMLLTGVGLALIFVDLYYVSIGCYIVVINLMLYLKIASALFMR